MVDINDYPLNSEQINTANSISLFGKRGDHANEDYCSYLQKINSWPISDQQKKVLMARAQKKYSELLRYEAQHVSTIVAGPSNYNAKKLDKTEKISQLTTEFCEWFERYERQAKHEKRLPRRGERIKRMVDGILKDVEGNYQPTKQLLELASWDNKEFIRLYEELQPRFKWRGNSNLAKAYKGALNGGVQEIEYDIFHECPDYTAYVEGKRAFITFTFYPRKPLEVALKSRRWWWNAYEQSFSNYLNRLDKEWVKSIGHRYEEYLL